MHFARGRCSKSRQKLSLSFLLSDVLLLLLNLHGKKLIEKMIEFRSFSAAKMGPTLKQSLVNKGTNTTIGKGEQIKHKKGESRIFSEKLSLKTIYSAQK